MPLKSFRTTPLQDMLQIPSETAETAGKRRQKRVVSDEHRAAVH